MTMRSTEYGAGPALRRSALRRYAKQIFTALLWRSGLSRKVTSGSTRKLRQKIARKDKVIARKSATIARKEQIIQRMAEQHARTREKNARTIDGKRNADLKKVGTLLASRAAHWTTEQRVLLLRAFRDIDLLCERDLHLILNQLFANREMQVVRTIVNDQSMGFDLVRDCYRLRLMSYNCDDSIPLDAIAELYGRARNSFLSGRILHEFLIRAVKEGAVDRIEATLSQLNERELGQITKATLKGVCRLLIENQRFEAAAHLLSNYIRPEKSDQVLYFLEPLLELDAVGVLRGGLQEFCEQLHPVSSVTTLEHLRTAYKPVDDADQRNFQRFVIDPLSALLRDAETLMDIRFSPQQRGALLERIKSSVISQTPLSLIRLGDGEGYAYPAPQVEGINPAVFENDNSSFERNWWEALAPPHVREDITIRVRQAVARCDILGFPSVYRIIRDLPPPHRPYGKNRNQRSFMRLLSALGHSIPVEQKLFTEERCNRCAITAPFLTELASLARSVLVVSCWPGMEAKFPRATVETITIPPTSHLRDLASGHEAAQLFDVYKDIAKRVRLMSGPGTLVLVGAGIIGKIFVDQARQAGAVALDIGSLLDYMAGFKTRTIAEVI